MMASNSGIPQVSTAGRRPVTSNQRALASSTTAPANVIASLKDEVRHLTGKVNRCEMQIAAQDQRIAALELLLSASTRSSASTASTGSRMPRNAEISKEIRATYREHQRENNGVGVIITSDAPNAADLNDDLKKKLALTSERMEAPATNQQQGNNILGRVVKHRATRRATEHVKYQKAKAREALLPAEVGLAKKHRRKLNSRRNMKRDRRHSAFLADSPKYMRSINDSRVSFDAINKILKASEMMSDEDDDEVASPDALNDLCDLLDNELPAQGKGKLQHKIAATVISDVDPPKNFKQKYNQWAFKIEAWSAAEREDPSVA